MQKERKIGKKYTFWSSPQNVPFFDDLAEKRKLSEFLNQEADRKQMYQSKALTRRIDEMKQYQDSLNNEIYILEQAKNKALEIEKERNRRITEDIKIEPIFNF